MAQIPPGIRKRMCHITITLAPSSTATVTRAPEPPAEDKPKRAPRRKAAPKAEAEAQADWRHPADHPLRGFILDNRAALGTLAVFVVMMAIFLVANPVVFTTWNLYSSVLTTLPVALFCVVPLVFVVTAGEIDLSFPATMGFASWVFALLVQAVEKKDADASQLAYLTDRVRVAEKKKQLYGTQLEQEGGTLRPAPIEDEANVDMRRQAIGLEPLSEYLEAARKAYAPAAEAPPAK